MKTSDLRLCETTLSTQSVHYRMPIKFGGRVMREVLLADVTVEAETRDGRRGRGFGSMPLASVWAWPSAVAGPTETQNAMLALAEELVRQANDDRPCGHPLEITRRLAASHAETSRRLAAGTLSGTLYSGSGSAGLPEAIPPLAQLVAASPLEAAIHDAFGKIHGRNSFDLLGPEWVDADLAAYLDERFAGEYLDRYTLRAPQPTMPLYHLVGALDPLSDAELATPVGDGLPETLGQWIAADGLTHLKIKLNGDDFQWDVQRVLSVERVAAEAQAARGCPDWRYSADFNEKCSSVEYLTEFLAQDWPRFACRPAALAVRRAAHAARPAGGRQRADGRGGEDQAGGDRRIAGRLRESALGAGIGVFGRRLEGLQGAERGPLDGGGGAEIRHVPVRPGFDLSRRLLLALGVAGRANPRRGCHRRQRPAVLPRGQPRLGRALSLDVPHHRRHGGHRRA